MHINEFTRQYIHAGAKYTYSSPVTQLLLTAREKYSQNKSKTIYFSSNNIQKKNSLQQLIKIQHNYNQCFLSGKKFTGTLSVNPIIKKNWREKKIPMS